MRVKVLSRTRKNGLQMSREDRKRKVRRKKRYHGKENGGGQKDKTSSGDKVQEEHEWKRETGEGNKHHGAYGGSDANSEGSSGDEQEKSEYEKLREKYSPQEITLLRSLRHEKDYIYNLKQNYGKRKSPSPQRMPVDAPSHYLPPLNSA